MTKFAILITICITGININHVLEHYIIGRTLTNSKLQRLKKIEQFNSYKRNVYKKFSYYMALLIFQFCAMTYTNMPSQRTSLPGSIVAVLAWKGSLVSVYNHVSS